MGWKKKFLYERTRRILRRNKKLYLPRLEKGSPTNYHHPTWSDELLLAKHKSYDATLDRSLLIVLTVKVFRFLEKRLIDGNF